MVRFRVLTAETGIPEALDASNAQWAAVALIGTDRRGRDGLHLWPKLGARDSSVGLLPTSRPLTAGGLIRIHLAYR